MKPRQDLTADNRIGNSRFGRRLRWRHPHDADLVEYLERHRVRRFGHDGGFGELERELDRQKCCRLMIDICGIMAQTPQEI